MYKKFTKIFFLLLCTITLCSCKNSKNNNAENRDSTATSENIYETCRESRYFKNGQSIVPSNNGFYALNWLSAYLTYINEAGEETILCGKPDCEHYPYAGSPTTLETCNATVSALPWSLVAYENYVYVLEYHDHEVSLVRINADGSEHKKMMVVGNAPDEGSYYSYLFTDSNTVYLIYNEPDYKGEERTISLDKIDLAEEKITSVYSYTSKGAYLSYLKNWNGKLYFTEVKEEKGSNGKVQSYLMEYDIKSGEAKRVVEDNVFSYTITDEGDIYYYIAGDGLYLLPFDARETKKSKKIQESTIDTAFVRLAYDGTYIYMDNFENRFYVEEASKQHMIYVCDKEGGILNSVKAVWNMANIVDNGRIFAYGEVEDEPDKWCFVDEKSILDPNAVWTFTEME